MRALPFACFVANADALLYPRNTSIRKCTRISLRLIFYLRASSPFFNYLDIDEAWFYQHSAPRNDSQMENVGSVQKTENGMLRGRNGRRDRLLFTYKATVPTLIVVMTTMSCSRPDMPQPRTGIFETFFLDPVPDAASTRSVQRDEGQPKVQRARPKTSASPKVATVHAPKATSASGPRPVPKKANTPTRLDAQRERQLFEEFLEWRKRQKGLP